MVNKLMRDISMENYYEILQVSPKASKQIIDKAYKTLAKTYHPDANPPEKKEWAEEQFKKINSAYEIISDEEKRKKYDKDLNRSIENAKRQAEQKYKNLQTQHEQLIKELNYLKSMQGKNIVPQNGANVENNTNMMGNQNIQAEIDRQVTQSVNRAYHDAYIQQMQERRYRIRYKKSFKEKIKDILALTFTICLFGVILWILWQFPAVREAIESNETYQFMIKLFDLIR